MVFLLMFKIKVQVLKLATILFVTLCNALMNKILIFHKRFSYLNHQALLHLLKNVKFVNFSSSLVHQALKIVCEACQMGKSHRLHFPTVEAKATKILELIHTNL